MRQNGAFHRCEIDMSRIRASTAYLNLSERDEYAVFEYGFSSKRRN